MEDIDRKKKKQIHKQVTNQARKRCKYLICVYAEKRRKTGEREEEQGVESVYLKPPGTGGLNRITW